MTSELLAQGLGTLCCGGEGEIKGRDSVDCERLQMFLEAQPAWQVSNAGIQPFIALRLLAAAGPEDRPNIDTRASAIELSVSDARHLARWLTEQVNQWEGGAEKAKG